MCSIKDSITWRLGQFCPVCQGFTFRLRENFLSEFRWRQRGQLLRQSVLTICLKRAQNFVFRLDVCSLAPYPAAIAAVLV